MATQQEFLKSIYRVKALKMQQLKSIQGHLSKEHFYNAKEQLNSQR